MAVPTERVANTSMIERRSIDYIPDGERHGRLFSQFTLWLGANLQITAIVTGALAVVLGDTDISWIIGLVVPAVAYYLIAKKWHSAIPDRLILPVDNDTAEGMPSDLRSQATLN